MKTDLDDFMDILDGAHRYDRYVHARCPFHQDSRPSFFVYDDRYYCAACSRRGWTSNLLKELKKSHIIFHPQGQNINNFNVWRKWMKNRSLKEILVTAWKNLPSIYLRERGISDDIQKRLHLGILEDWITFPIVDNDGRILGAIARAGKSIVTPSKYIIPPNQNPNLLYIPSWKLINQSDRIYVVFGIIDAITLFMLNKASISTTTGLRLDYSVLDGFRKELIFIPDFGEERQAHKIASRLGWRGKVMNFDYPDGCKDLNDTWTKYPDLLHNTLEL